MRRTALNLFFGGWAALGVVFLVVTLQPGGFAWDYLTNEHVGVFRLLPVLLLLIGTFIFVCPIPIYFARQRPGLRVRLAKLAVGLWIGIAAIIILWVGYVFWPESIFMQDTDCRTPEECAVPPRAYMVWFGITSLSGLTLLSPALIYLFYGRRLRVKWRISVSG